MRAHSRATSRDQQCPWNQGAQEEMLLIPVLTFLDLFLRPAWEFLDRQIILLFFFFKEKTLLQRAKSIPV